MDTAAVTLPPLLRKRSHFIGLLKLPESDTDTAPELDEIWPSDDDDSDSDPHPTVGPTFHKPEPVYPSPESVARSAPMNVPTWRHVRGGDVDYDDVDKEEEFVPPHVIVARSHVMTFSVFEGVGRTLKGRDLRRVRNAVFQKTGFLD